MVNWNFKTFWGFCNASASHCKPQHCVTRSFHTERRWWWREGANGRQQWFVLHSWCLILRVCCPCACVAIRVCPPPPYLVWPSITYRLLFGYKALLLLSKPLLLLKHDWLWAQWMGSHWLWAHAASSDWSWALITISDWLWAQRMSSHWLWKC